MVIMSTPTLPSPDADQSQTPHAATNTTNTILADPLVRRVAAAVRAHMASSSYSYDASHAFDHVTRVVGLSLHLLAHHASTSTSTSTSTAAPLDALVVVLAALTHDVADGKYAPAASVSDLLRANGASPALAARVEAVASGVSYSSEMADPTAAAALLARHREVAVVQDADRLDALGAVGIGRLFSFGGARGAADMEEGLRHVDDKLLKLEGLMKTARGRDMARLRTARLLDFKRAWREEVDFAMGFVGRDLDALPAVLLDSSSPALDL